MTDKTHTRATRPSSARAAFGLDTVSAAGRIDIAGGHRLRIVGSDGPEALALLIRGLSG